MYILETGLQNEDGMNADDLFPGDLAVVLGEGYKGHIVLKVRGCVIDLSDPTGLPIEGHWNVRVRKLSPGESITLTV